MKNDKKMLTFTKRLVAFIIVFCFINIEASYILALLGKDPLQDITNNLITTVLGTTAIYIVRAFFDSWSKAKYGDGSDSATTDDATITEPLSDFDFGTIIAPCSNNDDTNDDDNLGN